MEPPLHPGKHYILLPLVPKLISLSLCWHLQNLDESKQLESKALESLLLVLPLMASGSPGSMSDNAFQRYKLMTQSPAYAGQPVLPGTQEGPAQWHGQVGGHEDSPGAGVAVHVGFLYGCWVTGQISWINAPGNGRRRRYGQVLPYPKYHFPALPIYSTASSSHSHSSLSPSNLQ